jgi:hypothetical protein
LVRIFGAFVRKGIGRDQLSPSVGGADDDVDMFAMEIGKRFLERCLQRADRLVVGLEDEVAGGGERADIRVPQLFGDTPEVTHHHAAGLVDDDAVEQRDIGGHAPSPGLRRQ